VLIQSTFVRVCCPTATTLIEMKQLCGVAKARSFGIAATMSYRLDVAAIIISAFDSRACEMSQPYCFHVTSRAAGDVGCGSAVLIAAKSLDAQIVHFYSEKRNPRRAARRSPGSTVEEGIECLAHGTRIVTRLRFQQSFADQRVDFRFAQLDRQAA
jgi:hypothetical protein